MRTATLGGRAVLLRSGDTVDIERASGRRFGPDSLAVFQDWAAFTHWAKDADFTDAQPFDENELAAPVLNPSQIFAIGLNYADHADEANLDRPEDLVASTKSPRAWPAPTSRSSCRHHLSTTRPNCSCRTWLGFGPQAEPPDGSRWAPAGD